MLTKNKSRNIERLLYLAREVAKTRPDKKVGNRPPFYFGSYADYDKWDGKNQQLTCGTSACAIGLASTLPIFRRLGLRLKKVSDDWVTTTVQPYIRGGANSYNQSYIDVAEKLGLDVEEYCALFTPDAPPSWFADNASPQDVARNIRSFCKAAKKNQEEQWMNE